MFTGLKSLRRRMEETDGYFIEEKVLWRSQCCEGTIFFLQIFYAKKNEFIPVSGWTMIFFLF